MGASISYKLKSSLQGALAGGGDPATSPLYVFGPFLSLIVAAGVAKVTFGASIWMAVFTVVSVSAMYRYVMKWITDGSGGSGLSEEEFGGWAVKVNAAITVIEYTLTFLVSIAALVTFIVDRVPTLNVPVAGMSFRTLIAIVFSILIVFAVNRGPKVAAKFFGPATAAILLFLWVMVIAVVWQRGLDLPDFNFAAFDSQHLHFTLGGFARILALMTGIEIFANLVASYEGSSAQRSRRAYGSLLIVMGTTVITMVIVGPAILEISNPSDLSTSVFTQTMDALLPPWLSYAGTLIGIAVLLSAAAASAQGIQNLAMGLRARHYIPARWGMRNRFDVPSFPSWAQALIVVLAFVFFGTHEETYLALYAAGVFVLLSMTGWSAFKRFFRFFRKAKSFENALGIFITSFSATCASFATFIIFEERFFEGAWIYLIMVPGLYFGFDYYRRHLGAPPESIDQHLSSVISAQAFDVTTVKQRVSYKIDKILVPLSGSLVSEVAFYSALKMASRFQADMFPVQVLGAGDEAKRQGEQYLKQICQPWANPEFSLTPTVLQGELNKELIGLCETGGYDLICLSSKHLGTLDRLVSESMAYKIIYATTPPVLIFRPSDRWLSRATDFKNILVPLDGSKISEQVLPYVHAWASEFESKITLISVPEGGGDQEVVEKLRTYLNHIREKYFAGDMQVDCVVEGSGAARTILFHAQENHYDMIAMVSHGRGGLQRQGFVKLGSVTE
ncbi:MAG: hypothetical protein COT73_12695, partial [Bdellovibrio sp. CG10_big_fil_rev_8_21_14_0_10_47_8]